jgi:hypothetical protein
VIVADGTPEAARRLERVLTNDPGTGVMRHIDAGYEEAIECAGTWREDTYAVVEPFFGLLWIRGRPQRSPLHIFIASSICLTFPVKRLTF